MLPVNYEEARQRFLEEARRAQAELTHFPVDREEGVELATDLALFHGEPAAPVVLVASGTHGIEGYAGAACQYRFMQRHAAHFASSGLSFGLVHAVNPWGFFHDRRVTRENIDLNRNFIDFSQGLPAATDYAAYHARLLERFRPLPGGWRNELGLLAGAVTASQRRRIRSAITGGQHSHADGLFYGGRKASPSRTTWESIAERCAAGRQTVLLLDLHTGLGRYGHGELLSYLPADMPDFQEMNGWLHGELVSMGRVDAISAAVAGTLTEGFDRKSSGKSYAIGLEFGTRAALPVLYALRLDHWVSDHAGPLGPAWRERARKAMRHAFRPDDPRWLDMVLARFDQVMEWIVAGLVQKKQKAG
jgi:predicted deacylase